MARTITTYTGNGFTTLYPVDFPLGYINKDHVYVYLEGSDYTDQLSYTWQNDTEIELTTPPAPNVQFSIRRVVPRSALVNDYTDGAILRENNLDDSFKQALMALEEVADGFATTDETFTLNTDLDMLGNKIQNLAAAVLDNDAVSYLFLREHLLNNEYVKEQDLPDFILSAENFILTTNNENVELTSGQTVVTLSGITTVQASVYVSGPNVDTSRLVKTIGFTVDSDTQITLTESYPEGTILSVWQNEGAEETVSDIQTADNVTVMKAASLSAGDTITCARYSAGGSLVTGLTYYIKTAAQAAIDGDVINETMNHTLVNGNVAILKLNADGSFTDTQVGGLIPACNILATGGHLKVTQSYELSSGINVVCSDNVKIELAQDVVISAAVGFPATKLLQFGGGNVATSFQFSGGYLKGTNVPFSGAGEANDLLYVTSFSSIKVSNVDMDCETGSDSCLFTADYDFCHVYKNKFRNPPDAGLYTSGPGNGSGRGSCLVENNYAENCGNECYTGKRNLERFILNSNEGVNSSFGVATAEADGIPPAQHISWSNNTFRRCTTSMLARLCKSGNITGNTIYELGIDGGTTAGTGIELQGSKKIAVTGNSIRGGNPDSTLVSGFFTGYVVKERLFNAVTTYSQYNSIDGGIVADIGKVVREEGTLNNDNSYLGINPDNISGTNYTIGSDTSVVVGRNILGEEWAIHFDGGQKFSVQGPATDDEAYITFGVQESGIPIIKRVKQGATNSGPAGVGRALFVDN